MAAAVRSPACRERKINKLRDSRRAIAPDNHNIKVVVHNIYVVVPWKSAENPARREGFPRRSPGNAGGRLPSRIAVQEMPEEGGYRKLSCVPRYPARSIDRHRRVVFPAAGSELPSQFEITAAMSRLFFSNIIMCSLP